ncbi:hypothetical protein JOF56_011651 [Kibdelosporangium banguiense]|uniref:DUF3499 domain-containing protein n=1 Tax=Kibdelosporangium banguiense TaxID=1365924 RepID=A0ABS4U3N7_9PSEU|nr:hypothetical protein [Kibdelosporangium banguiense]MBP2331266.1 hypothetical protein [Kibdelosporangium banguiense]
MAETAHTATARKAFTCQGYRCRLTVAVGEAYARHVAFPGSEVNDGPAPLVLKICERCHTEYGKPMPTRRLKRRSGTADPPSPRAPHP